MPKIIKTDETIIATMPVLRSIDSPPTKKNIITPATIKIIIITMNEIKVFPAPKKSVHKSCWTWLVMPNVITLELVE